MDAPPPRRYRLRWTRRDLAGLLILLAAGWAWTAWDATGRRVGFAGDAPPADAARVAAAREKIDPNTASPASLQRLHGVGPARAADIVAYREAHGPRAFRTAADLTRIRGIGPVTVAGMAGELALPPEAPAGGPKN